MLKPSAPHFDPEDFCTQGKVMDGWETRRRRLPGHDWALVRLGLSGFVHGVELDTAHFTGNQAMTPKTRLGHKPETHYHNSPDQTAWTIH